MQVGFKRRTADTDDGFAHKTKQICRARGRSRSAVQIGEQGGLEELQVARVADWKDTVAGCRGLRCPRSGEMAVSIGNGGCGRSVQKRDKGSEAMAQSAGSAGSRGGRMAGS